MAYSKKAREKILAKFSQLRESGKTTQQAARSVGVSYMTVLRWERSGGKGGKAAVKTRKAVNAQPRLSLTTPAGFRIEADSARDIIQVLKAIK